MFWGPTAILTNIGRRISLYDMFRVRLVIQFGKKHFSQGWAKWDRRSTKTQKHRSQGPHIQKRGCCRAWNDNVFFGSPRVHLCMFRGMCAATVCEQVLSSCPVKELCFCTLSVVSAMVFLRLSQHPRGLGLSQQRKVYVRRTVHKESWRTIAPQVCNLQGDPGLDATIFISITPHRPSE